MGAQMTPRGAHTPYHPRWYRRRVSTYWWLHQWSFVRFILRELSSVFIGLAVVLTLLQVHALSCCADGYHRLQQYLAHPLVIAFHCVSLAFVVFHAVTWFNLAPKAVPRRVHGKHIPALLITLPNYVAWAGISVLVAWIILGG
jgi:fumarate reductase subunit C